MKLPSLQIARFTSNAKFQASFIVVVLTLVYLFGLEWPLLLAILAAFAVMLPMPRVFASWLSRAVVALLIVYSVLQIAFLLQFLTYPKGGFRLVAILFAALALLVIMAFGDALQLKRRSVIGIKDLLVLIPVVLFVLSFSSIMIAPNRVVKITALAGVQISDSIAHSAMISDALQTQNLNFKVGGYYPVGYHDATAYIEHSLFGNVNNTSWTAHVMIYVAQYVFFALLMVYAMLYLGYSFLLGLGIDERGNKLVYSTTAVAIGSSAVIMQLLLFVRDGFLNFFYICAAVIVAIIYLLDIDVVYQARRQLRQNIRLYTWPLTAFLLLAFGAGFSWTLLVPPLLLTAGLTMVPDDWRQVIRQWKDYAIANSSLMVLGLCNLASLYLQHKYLRNSSQQLNAQGALSSFNVPFLLLGLSAATFVIATNFHRLGRRVMIIIAPLVAFITILLLGQLFRVGEARYYIIKSSILLEIFSLVLVSVMVVYALRASSLSKVFQLVWGTVAVLFLVVGTISLMPQPLLEARSLLRDASHVVKPPFLDSDAQKIAYLGTTNKIQSFNFSVLHYDAASNKLYAHIETAAWANAMTKANADPAALTSDGRITSGACFGTQFTILAYGTGSQQEQQRLIDSVQDCIHVAKVSGLTFYIVTDPASATKLQQLFGNTPVFVTN